MYIVGTARTLKEVVLVLIWRTWNSDHVALSFSWLLMKAGLCLRSLFDRSEIEIYSGHQGMTKAPTLVPPPVQPSVSRGKSAHKVYSETPCRLQVYVKLLWGSKRIAVAKPAVVQKVKGSRHSLSTQVISVSAEDHGFVFQRCWAVGW